MFVEIVKIYWSRCASIHSQEEGPQSPSRIPFRSSVEDTKEPTNRCSIPSPPHRLGVEEGAEMKQPYRIKPAALFQ